MRRTLDVNRRADAKLVSVASGANWAGWALALTATLCFSTATPIGRAAITSGLNPTALLVGRILLAVLLMGATVAATNPALLKADRRCLVISSVAGLLSGMGMLGYFWGLSYLDASMAAMLISISPLAVLTLLALRGERFTYRHIVRMALALAGVYLLIGPGGQVNMSGVALILAAILAFAGQFVLIQWYVIEQDARTVTFYVLLAMSLVVVAWWAAQGAPWTEPGVYGWLSIISLAVLSTFIARWCLFGAVSRLGGSQVAMLTPLETLLAVVWSLLFLDEHLTLIQWLGGGLILISAALAIKRLGLARWRPRWRVWTRS